MDLSSLSVKRGVAFAMAYLVLIFFGLFSLSRLELDLFPDLTFPTVAVLTTYTGASPEDMETLVTRPLESSVAGVEGVEEVDTSSSQGLSVVQANFSWETDMDQAETDVRRALDMVEGILPEDADAPIVFAMDPSMEPIAVVAVGGELPADELRTLAEEQIQPALERVPGVASASVGGGLERQIHIVLDPARMEAHDLDLDTVVAAVGRENLQEPGGVVSQGVLEYNIQTSGRYGSIEDIEAAVVGSAQTAAGPVPVRLGDVAEVEDTFSEARRVVEVDGEPTVLLQVRKQSGENTVRAVEALEEALPGIQQSAGPDVHVRVLTDQAEFINRSLGNLATTALAGVLISFLVVLFFLRDLRAALVVSTAIPLSVVATFGVMDQLGMTLNIISMAGLALAIGMLVDNAIVVLEATVQAREEGEGPRMAAITGARTVSTAVIAATLTTVSVFLPVLFVPGIAGALFQDMAVTIVAALVVSLIVALSFVPLAASRLLTGPPRAGSDMGGLRQAYGRAIDWSLSHRWLTVGLVAGVVVLGSALVPMVRTDFMARPDRSEIQLSVETPVGLGVAETAAITDEVVAKVREVVPPEELESIRVDVGEGDGFAALFGASANAGSVDVQLVSMGERSRSQAQIEDEIRRAVRDVPGVDVSVTAHGPTGGAGDLSVILRGHDLDEARVLGEGVRDELLALPEVAEVDFSLQDQAPQVVVDLDRPKLGELGMSASAVGRTVSTAFQGRLAGRYAEDGDEHDILVRLAPEYRQDIEQLRRLPLTTPTGASVPLANVAEVEVDLGPVGIDRMDQERITTLTVTLADEWVDEAGASHGKDLAASLASVDALLTATPMPEGFTWEVGGSAEDFVESFSWLGVALIVSIFLVYMVMAGQFESLRQPFVILLTVPLGLVGVVAAFALTGRILDVTALIGAIMLVGIAVNNGIVLVDAANQLRDQGRSVARAAAEAARLRLRPVLLTSLTTILSMVPLALEIGEGSEQWSPMAVAVMGGLAASTALTLFLVPTVYALVVPEKSEETASAASEGAHGLVTVEV